MKAVLSAAQGGGLQRWRVPAGVPLQEVGAGLDDLVDPVEDGGAELDGISTIPIGLIGFAS
jgi:hypothetical protein